MPCYVSLFESQAIFLVAISTASFLDANGIASRSESKVSILLYQHLGGFNKAILQK
jgi:hypothetical protein